MAAQIRILEQVFFNANSTDVLPRYVPVLDAVAAVLRASPQIQAIELQGNASDDEPSAWSLALNRAAMLTGSATVKRVAPANSRALASGAALAERLETVTPVVGTVLGSRGSRR